MIKKIVISIIVITILSVSGYFVYWKVSERIIIESLEKISSFGPFTSDSEVPDVIEESSEDYIEAGQNPVEQEEKNDAVDDNTPNPKLNRLSPEDRAYVMSIYARFTSGEISEVTGLMSGQMTPEKKKQIKQIVFSKISRDEYNRLCILADKYGY